MGGRFGLHPTAIVHGSRFPGAGNPLFS